MLQVGTHTPAVLLSDMPDGAFFRVQSLTAAANCPEYASQYMISVYDTDLPKPMRRGDETSALFLLSSVSPGTGVPTEVVVQEIDYDIPDSTQVLPISPVTNMSNGAYVRLHGKPATSKDFHSLRIGVLDEYGRLKAGRSRRRGGRGRNERRSGRHR